ncbi:hypothetical protein DAI22_02g196300 [Oryza sativa Japonica Group]|nr:hypothetical protein DAI22_02g196300 [Oryza sativa Japonica Group]
MSTEAETTSAGAPAPAPAPASAPARCQRIGCDATFTDDNNPDGSCQYHPSGPMFHDGMKQWSCCKQKSHDFSLFLAIPGCKTGKHTTEKPITKAVPTKPSKAVPVQTSKQSVGADTCSRCRQGFFCSDHDYALLFFQDHNPRHKYQPLPVILTWYLLRSLQFHHQRKKLI